jgi:hypothetical protein
VDKPAPAHRQPAAQFLGWYDANYWYLLEKPMFNAVMEFYRHGGSVFPDSARGVKIKLLERGMLHPSDSDRYRYKVKIGPEYIWVHRITRNIETA